MSEFIGTKLTMNLGERSYDIIVKRGSLENLYQFARLDRRVAVVTDSGVPAQYAQMVADQCKDAHIITVPQGEASKSFKILESVLRQMLEFGMGRGDLVIAVGGGVVGDLAGFAASIYMRGIDFINVQVFQRAALDDDVVAALAQIHGQLGSDKFTHLVYTPNSRTVRQVRSSSRSSAAVSSAVGSPTSST